MDDLRGGLSFGGWMDVSRPGYCRVALAAKLIINCSQSYFNAGFLSAVLVFDPLNPIRDPQYLLCGLCISRMCFLNPSFRICHCLVHTIGSCQFCKKTFHYSIARQNVSHSSKLCLYLCKVKRLPCWHEGSVWKPSKYDNCWLILLMLMNYSASIKKPSLGLVTLCNAKANVERMDESVVASVVKIKNDWQMLSLGMKHISRRYRTNLMGIQGYSPKTSRALLAFSGLMINHHDPVIIWNNPLRPYFFRGWHWGGTLGLPWLIGAFES